MPEIEGGFASMTVVAILNCFMVEFAIDCFAWFDAARSESGRITAFVTDNASADGSGQVIRNYGCSDWVKLKQKC